MLYNGVGSAQEPSQDKSNSFPCVTVPGDLQTVVLRSFLVLAKSLQTFLIGHRVQTLPHSSYTDWSGPFIAKILNIMWHLKLSTILIVFETP